jgi:translation initiation factor RLI1
MIKPKATVDATKCRPETCRDTGCAAVKVCEKKVLIQEDKTDPPYVLQQFCTGCGKCIAACPFKAINKG